MEKNVDHEMEAWVMSWMLWEFRKTSPSCRTIANFTLCLVINEWAVHYLERLRAHCWISINTC